MIEEKKISWILLWDQIQKHYGDIKKEESTQQFIGRMMTKFNLELKESTGNNQWLANLLNSEHI